MRRLRALLPLAAFSLLLAGCGAAEQAAPGPAAPGPAVVTSTDVYGAIVRAVGGDRVAVTSLISDPAADPHSYESTPADALTVGRADLVVLNGGGYDDFVTRLADSATPKKPQVVDVSVLSGLAPAAEQEHAAQEPDEHGHGEFNEHVWYDLPTVAKLAGTLATDLGALDPAGAAGYAANATAFTARLGELERRAAAIGVAAPGARVAVTEPVPVHLVRAAGLTDATPAEFAEAVEEDTDPPAAVVAQTLALFQGPDRVRALIVNAQTVTPTTEQVRSAAEAAGVPVIEMTETLPAGQADYVAWMGSQIDALAGALGSGR